MAITVGTAVQNGGLPPKTVSDTTAGTQTPACDIAGSQFGAVITSNVITRPSDTTAYASGDLVANSVTAASVTPFSFLLAASVSGGVCRVDRIRLQKSTTSVTNSSFRVHLYKATPGTPTNGDNGAWVTALANYIGAVDITVDRAFSDGAEGAGIPIVGNSILCMPTATTLFGLLEARAAYTPGSAETFTLIAELYRY